MVVRGEKELSRATNRRTARSFMLTKSWVAARFAACLSRSEVVVVRRGKRDLAEVGDSRILGLTVNKGGKRWVGREKGKKKKKKKKRQERERREKGKKGEKNYSRV